MTNPVFNSYGSVNEQVLWDRMVNESISIYGMDMYYLPRKRVAFDQIYYEDGQSVFDAAYLIDVYMKSTEGFIGQGTFMSQLGMFEVRDRFIFSIGITEFANEVTTKRPSSIRPFDSDWLYFPMNQRIFEIINVTNKPFFYQVGELQMYDLTCELIEYSNEKLETGITDIDAIQARNSTNMYDYALKDEDGQILTNDNGDVLVTDKYDRNQEQFDPTRDNKSLRIEVSSNNVISFDERNPLANNQVY